MAGSEWEEETEKQVVQLSPSQNSANLPRGSSGSSISESWNNTSNSVKHRYDSRRHQMERVPIKFCDRDKHSV